jgi:hypothetical protein
MCTGKGQSAIEYLMTYGWMLLVVALIGGAVFSLVQGQAIESVSGFTGTEVSINDFGMNSDDELMLSIRNTAADRVKVKAVELEDPETGATTRVLSEKQIEVGDRKTVKVDGFERTSSSNKQNLKIIYGSGGIDDQVVEGTITGKLKAKNHVYLQNAAFNRSTNTLNITAQNTGNTEATVDYAVNSDSNSFTGNLGTLPSGETTSFTVNTDETFPLQNVSLNVDGQYFSNSQKQLKCTPTNGLVGYWPLEEGQGDTAYDYSGRNNHGIIEGATWRERMTGSSLEFDGQNDYVNLGDSANEVMPYGNSSRSITAQVKMETCDDNIIHILHYGENSRGQAWGIAANCGNNPTLMAHEWNYYGGAGNVPYEKSNLAITMNSTGYKKHYIDGDYVGYENTLPDTDLERNPKIGARVSGGENWNGIIGSVRIYNRTLSQVEIKSLEQTNSNRWTNNVCKFE